MTDRLQLFFMLTVYALPGLVIGFTLHELMHAVVADRLGDPLPRAQGRISVDPMKQIDPLGFGLLIAIGFGFARPVQINPLRLRTPGARALVAFAGPCTNLVLAILIGIVLQLYVHASPDVVHPTITSLDDVISFSYPVPGLGHGGAGYILFLVLYQTMYVNALLFVFNMIPIPPLDGFAVLKGALGRQIPDVIAWMERNSGTLFIAGLLLLFALPRLGDNSGGNVIQSGVDHIVSAVYGGTTPLVSGIESLLQALSG